MELYLRFNGTGTTVLLLFRAMTLESNYNERHATYGALELFDIVKNAMDAGIMNLSRNAITA